MKVRKNSKIISVIFLSIGLLVISLSFVYYFKNLNKMENYKFEKMYESSTKSLTNDSKLLVKNLFKYPEVYIANESYVVTMSFNNSTKTKAVAYNYIDTKNGNIYAKGITMLEYNNRTINRTRNLSTLEFVKYNDDIIMCFDTECYYINLSKNENIRKEINEVMIKYVNLTLKFYELVANNSTIKCKNSTCEMIFNINNDLLKKYYNELSNIFNLSNKYREKLNKTFEMFKFNITGKFVSHNRTITEISYNITALVTVKNITEKIEGKYIQKIIGVNQELVENIIKEKYTELKKNSIEVANPTIYTVAYTIYLDLILPKIF